MEDLINEIQEHFNLFDLLDSLDEYVQIMDENLQVIWCNQKGKEITANLGLPYMGQTDLFAWLVFLKPYQEKIKQEYQKVLKTNDILITKESQTYNGKTIHTRTTKMPLTKNDSKYIITFVHDETDLINLKNNIKDERDKLFAVFDSIKEAIYVADVNSYEILYVNPYIANLVRPGVPLDQFIGQKCYRVFQNKDAPCDFCTNPIILNNNEAPYRWEFHNENINMDFLITDKLIDWPDGRKVRFELAFDITDETQTKHKLRETIQELEQSNQMLSDFAHIVSHDLREPLRTVVGFLQILKNDENNCHNENRDVINRAYQGGIRMQKMVNELLLLSKLNRQTSFQKSLIDTNKLINDVINDLHQKIEDSHASIQIDGLLEFAYAEPELLRQVFLNLIHNSLKYKKDSQPQIDISSERNDEYTIYIVEDNGIGMSESDIQAIFHDKSAWDSPATLKGGMGLSICRRVIELHGGKIDVESDGLNGTKVILCLPNKGVKECGISQ